MKTLKNNKGVTLVEIIVGVLIFAIASITLVQGFVTSANIINRATLYKNASAAASSSVELQEAQPSSDSNVNVALQSTSDNLKISGVRDNTGRTVTTTVEGSMVVGVDNGNSKIRYREFVPGDRAFLDIE